MKGHSIVTTLLAFGILTGCGESAKEKTEHMQRDSVHRFDSLVKPRKDIYDAALSALKDLLKVPSTAKFPPVLLTDDTVKIRTDGSRAFVVFPYDAQNPMGTYMHDIAAVRLIRSNGKWGLPGHYDDVEGSAIKDYWKNFDFWSNMEFGTAAGTSSSSAPPPTPAPPTKVAN